MLSSKYLISPSYSLESLLIAGDSHIYCYYIHTSEGLTEVASGTSLVQSIHTLAPSRRMLNHAEDQFNKISNHINLSFKQVFDPALADISFYWDSEIELDDTPGVTYGLTLTNYLQNPKKVWYEVFLNATDLEQRSFDFNAYVFNHELLHTLGFEHTFDDSDGDYYLSTDPLQSATPEETTMSYRTPSSGVYPIDFSEADYQALLDIWGPSLDLSFYVYRLYNPHLDSHLFTSNFEEIDILTGVSSTTQTPQTTFINEGVAYLVGNGADHNLYRFYDTTRQRHFYSANDDEKNILNDIEKYPHLIFEGVAFKVFSALGGFSDSLKTPVFRFFDAYSNTHFYTATENERLVWEQIHPTWINEGIAWYA